MIPILQARGWLRSLVATVNRALFGDNDDVATAASSAKAFNTVWRARVGAGLTAGESVQERAYSRVAAAAGRVLIEQIAAVRGIDLQDPTPPDVANPEHVFLVLGYHGVTLASLSCDAYSAGEIPDDVDGLSQVVQPYLESLDYLSRLPEGGDWPRGAVLSLLGSLVYNIAVAEGWLGGNRERQVKPKGESRALKTGSTSVPDAPRTTATTGVVGGVETLSAMLLEGWDRSPETPASEALTLAALRTKDKAETARAFMVEVSRALSRQGLSAHLAPFIAAQAVAETGWGVSIPRTETVFSWNALGIKKRARHTQGVVNTTQEFVNGKGQRVAEEFAVFASFTECFEDYLFMMQTFPRYEDVLKATSIEEFAAALKKGGYATDPAYEELLVGVYKGRTFRRALTTPFMASLNSLLADSGVAPIDLKKGAV